MSTFNKILIAALVVQVGLALVIRASSDSGEALRNPEPLLAGFDGSQVTRIAIFDEPRPEPAKQGEGEAGGEAGDVQTGDEPAIDLRRESSGSQVQWKLASHFGHAAKTGEVDALLEKLASLQSRGPVVTSEVRHKQLHVAADDYRRKLVIETGAGRTTLYVGAPAGSRQVSVRIEGQDAVHQVGEISAAGLSLTPTTWVDTSYLNLSHSRVVYMAVRNKSGSYELQRTPRGRWALVQDGQPYPVPAGKKFNAIAADNWVKEAVRIAVAAPADPDRVLDEPLATITLHLKPEGQDAPAGDGGGDGGDQGAGAQDAGAAEDTATGAAAQPGAGGDDGDGDGDGTAVDGEAGEAAVSQGLEQYVIEIGAGDDDQQYYVRLQGSPTAAMVRKGSLRNLVEMNDGVVLIPAEK